MTVRELVITEQVLRGVPEGLAVWLKREDAGIIEGACKVGRGLLLSQEDRVDITALEGTKSSGGHGPKEGAAKATYKDWPERSLSGRRKNPGEQPWREAVLPLQRVGASHNCPKKNRRVTVSVRSSGMPAKRWHGTKKVRSTSSGESWRDGQHRCLLTLDAA